MLSTLGKVLVLRQMDLFAEVPAEELVPIAYIAAEVAFPAGTQFITQGEQGTAVYILVRGAVDIVLPEVGPVARRPAPTIIGEMAMFTRRPRTAHCIAATDVTALEIDHDDFRALLGAKPVLAYGIIQVLATRLEEASAALRAPGIRRAGPPPRSPRARPGASRGAFALESRPCAGRARSSGVQRWRTTAPMPCGSSSRARLWSTARPAVETAPTATKPACAGWATAQQ